MRSSRRADFGAARPDFRREVPPEWSLLTRRSILSAAILAISTNPLVLISTMRRRRRRARWWMEREQFWRRSARQYLDFRAELIEKAVVPRDLEAEFQRTLSDWLASADRSILLAEIDARHAARVLRAAYRPWEPMPPVPLRDPPSVS
jgi:hypothetical protein